MIKLSGEILLLFPMNFVSSASNSSRQLLKFHLIQK